LNSSNLDRKNLSEKLLDSIDSARSNCFLLFTGVAQNVGFWYSIGAQYDRCKINTTDVWTDNI